MSPPKIIAIDTSVLIHHANDDKRFGESATKVIGQIAKGRARGIISVVGVTEYLSLKPPGRQVKTSLPSYTEELLAWLMSIPNLDVVEITVSMAIEAARFRTRYGFKTPDALHLACAVTDGADEFVTSDKKLLKCKEIRVKLL